MDKGKLAIKIIRKICYLLTDWIKDHKKACLLALLVAGCLILMCAVFVAITSSRHPTDEGTIQQGGQPETPEDEMYSLDNYNLLTANNIERVSVNGYIISLGESTLEDVSTSLGIRNALTSGEWTAETYNVKPNDSQHMVDVITIGSCQMADENEEIVIYVKAFGETMPEDWTKIVVWGIRVCEGGMFEMTSSYAASGTLQYNQLVESMGKPIQSSLPGAAADEAGTAVVEPLDEAVPPQGGDAESYTARWIINGILEITVEKNIEKAGMHQAITALTIKVME